MRGKNVRKGFFFLNIKFSYLVIGNQEIFDKLNLSGKDLRDKKLLRLRLRGACRDLFVRCIN